jgi:hypothetical protein
MNSSRFLVLCFIPIACLVAAFAFGGYDPWLDLNHDGIIDRLDLFEGGNHWQDGVGATDLLALMRAWHGEEQTGDRILSLPEQFPVPLEDFGEGFFMGTVSIPVQLSEVNGLTEMEIWLPMSLDMGESGYSAFMAGGDLTALTAGFELISDLNVVDEVVYDVFKISSVDPITESGAGDLLTLQVTVSGQAPLAEDFISPLVFAYVRLLGVDGVEIPYSVQNGSILVNPSGQSEATFTPTRTVAPPSATPTRTPTGGSTRTPTPTRTKGPATATDTPTQTPNLGAADSLQIVACEPQEYAGNMLNIYVDQIDAEGHIVNPGVEGGDAPRAITVTVNGSATIGGIGQNRTFDADDLDEEGLKVSIGDKTPQEVTVTAGAPGVVAAEPFVVEFLPGGNISGTVEISDGQGGFRPANMMEVSVAVHIPGATDEVTGTMTQMGIPPNPSGYYETQYFAPGTYDVSFEPLPYGAPVVPFQPLCIQGVEVIAGETTTLNAQLSERTGPRVFGSLTTNDGETLAWATVTLSPSEGSLCGLAFYVAQGELQGDLMTYEFTAVPAGSYRIVPNASRADDVMYTGAPATVDVGDQDVEQDLELRPFPVYSILLVSPVDYARVANPPTLVWSPEDGAPEMIYRVSVMDRCNQEIWVKTDVRATQVKYGGPAIQRNNIYSWFVTGIATDGSSSGISQIAGTYTDAFLVE